MYEEKNTVYKNNADAHSQKGVNVRLSLRMFSFAIGFTSVYAFTSAAQE